MVKKRSYLNLLEVEGELYAVGGDHSSSSVSIEKFDKGLGVWRVVAELDEDRYCCRSAAVGSKIYVFGGYEGDHNSTWNAFDVGTGQWASASTPASKRKLSSRGGFSNGQAMTVPPNLLTH